MADYDAGRKRLFSHPEMMADLITGFVKEPWVAEIDFSTLERFNASFVSDDFRNRESDVIWRVEFRGRKLYVYLLLEFQSTVDRFMALRMVVYVGLLYQDLIRRGEIGSGEKLPPVLPIVLYNGDPTWTAATDLSTLIAEAPKGLDRYRPQMEYLLIEEGALEASELAGMQNLAAAVFQLEQSRTDEDIYQVISSLAHWLRAPEQSELRRTLAEWIRKQVSSQHPRLADFHVPDNLQEFDAMLKLKQFFEEKFDQAYEEGVQDGIAKGVEQGVEQGIEQGIERGEKEVLLSQLRAKFGPLDDDYLQQFDAADRDQLLCWAQRVLSAETIDEVFDANE